MTSASELFYGRRSRLSRSSLDLGGLELSLDRSFHQHHRHTHGHANRRRQHLQNPTNTSSPNSTRRDHQDLDGCDPLRRSGSSVIRHHLHSNRPSNSAERDTVRLDEGSSQSSSGSTINLENIIRSTHNRQRFNGNDRLPGAVILARERLLERLRGAALSGNRRNNRTLTGNNQGTLEFGDDFRLIAGGDWETNFPRDLVLQETSHNNRPPGLRREALNCLKVEVFSKTKCSSSSNQGVCLECSICLENFLEGEELLCLACGHRFHSNCLYPWVRSCGDCPYCRREIVPSIKQ